MNNLAVVLDNLGKYDEAEQIYRQALALSGTRGDIAAGSCIFFGSDKSGMWPREWNFSI